MFKYLIHILVSNNKLQDEHYNLYANTILGNFEDLSIYE